MSKGLRSAPWRRLALAGLVAQAGVVVAPQVMAQEGVQIEQFMPVPTGDQGYTHVMGASPLGHMRPAFGLYVDYGHQPLVLNQGGTVQPLVLSQIQGNALAALGLGKRFEVGVAMPLILSQSSDLQIIGVPEVSSFAIGDLRVVGKAGLLMKETGPNLSLAATVGAPTGQVENMFGYGGLTAHGQAVFEWRFNDRARAGINAGYLYKTAPQTLSTLTVGSELTYGLGANIALVPDKFNLLIEGFGRAEPTDLRQQKVPVEALVSARFKLADHHMITVGGGPGITRGYGTPVFRGLVGYSFVTGEAGGGDRDKDGIKDKDDECPKEAEDLDGYQDTDGCPDTDNDRDGISDSSDKCPDKAEDKDKFQDADGCPDPDNDADGILDGDDKCPDEAESANQIEDEDGCPEPDTDGDTFIDPLDKCPNEAEIVNGVEDEDGCPEPDSDGDRIIDQLDKCKDKPELVNNFQDDDGCPEKDTDKDGIVDGLDKCVKNPETVNNFEDEDGCPEKDTDKDGIVDGQDNCPKQRETKNGYQDEDGCPDTIPVEDVPDQGPKDADGDGIFDDTDKCVKEPETKNGHEDEDGCPDKLPPPPPSGDEKTGKIIIFFAFNSAQVDTKGQEIVDSLAAYLKEHPDQKVRLLGFTDSVGENPYNDDLSQRRAYNVRKALMAQGIQKKRVEVRGMGEKWPRAENTTDEGRAQNRRVRVLVIGPDGKVIEELPSSLLTE